MGSFVLGFIAVFHMFLASCPALSRVSVFVHLHVSFLSLPAKEDTNKTNLYHCLTKMG